MARALCIQSSLDYMIDKGMIYDASLMGDDIPYILQTNKGQVMNFPLNGQWTIGRTTHAPDMHYLMPIKSPDEAMNVFMSEFEAMRRHQGLWITVWHPFVSGRLARCERVSQMISMQGTGDVWFATMEEIAVHVQKCIDDGSWEPRMGELPYYDGPIPELQDGTLRKTIREGATRSQTARLARRSRRGFAQGAVRSVFWRERTLFDATDNTFHKAVKVGLKLTIKGLSRGDAAYDMLMPTPVTGHRFIAPAAVFGGHGCFTYGSSAPTWTDPA